MIMMIETISLPPIEIALQLEWVKRRVTMRTTKELAIIMQEISVA
jgi:hypothetical protein